MRGRSGSATACLGVALALWFGCSLDPSGTGPAGDPGSTSTTQGTGGGGGGTGGDLSGPGTGGSGGAGGAGMGGAGTGGAGGGMCELPTMAAAAMRTGPIVVDGELEAAWDGPQEHIAKVTALDPGNVTATFQTRWDETTFYVGVDVEDDNRVNDSSAIWDDDAVEIYFDVNNDAAGSYEEDDFWYVVGWDGTFYAGAGSDATGVEYGAFVTPNGYSIELAVPWATLQVGAPAAGVTMGFDVGVDVDNDVNNHQMDGQLMWWGVYANFYDTTEFGDVTLVDCP